MVKHVFYVKKHCSVLFNTIWTHMFIISSILTVTEGGNNDIGDNVST